MRITDERRLTTSLFASILLTALFLASATEARGDAVLDRLFYKRQAFSLGDDLAYVTIIQAQLGQEQAPNERVVNGLRGIWRNIEKRVEWLGISTELDHQWINSSRTADKKAAFKAGFGLLDGLARGLDTHLGVEVSS